MCAGRWPPRQPRAPQTRRRRQPGGSGGVPAAAAPPSPASRCAPGRGPRPAVLVFTAAGVAQPPFQQRPPVCVHHPATAAAEPGPGAPSLLPASAPADNSQCGSSGGRGLGARLRAAHDGNRGDLVPAPWGNLFDAASRSACGGSRQGGCWILQHQGGRPVGHCVGDGVVPACRVGEHT